MIQQKPDLFDDAPSCDPVFFSTNMFLPSKVQGDKTDKDLMLVPRMFGVKNDKPQKISKYQDTIFFNWYSQSSTTISEPHAKALATFLIQVKAPDTATKLIQFARNTQLQTPSIPNATKLITSEKHSRQS